MKTTLDSYLNFLGLGIQGDIGPYTCYRSSRGGVIWFLKAPPRCPPSDLQNQLREKWRLIIVDWTELDAATRANWDLICDEGSLYINGINLYIWWRCSQDDSIIHTLERQTGITLL